MGRESAIRLLMLELSFSFNAGLLNPQFDTHICPLIRALHSRRVVSKIGRRLPC